MRTLFVLILGILLSACAGRDFVRPQSDALKLGATKYEQLVKNFGEPSKTETGTLNGVPVKSATYSYSSSTPLTTKLATKVLICIFNEELLVSYDYASSFDDEKQSAIFEEDLIKKISKGDKKQDVLATLGTPGGEAIYPVTPTKGHTLLRYSFLETYRIPFVPTPRITRKLVIITFDQSDSVVDIATMESKPD